MPGPTTASHSPFRITGLPTAPFRRLFGLSEADLATHHVVRHLVDRKPGFPDRIALRDAEVGESVILVNHAHLPGPGPYRSSHAVFVIEGIESSFDGIDTIPEVLRPRMLSLRAFDRDGMMIDADLVDGREIETLIERLFANRDTVFLHVHDAKRGCYACRVDRVDRSAGGDA